MEQNLVSFAWVSLGAAAIVGIALVFDGRERKRIMTARETAEEMIRNADQKSDSVAFAWLRTAGWAVAPFALPVGAAAVVAGHLARAAKYGFNVRREKMPEHWYDQVIAESSTDGQLFLGKKLKKQGYVTVAQAAEWLEIESKARTGAASGKEKLIALHSARPSIAGLVRRRINIVRGKLNA